MPTSPAILGYCYFNYVQLRYSQHIHTHIYKHIHKPYPYMNAQLLLAAAAACYLLLRKIPSYGCWAWTFHSFLWSYTPLLGLACQVVVAAAWPGQTYSTCCTRDGNGLNKVRVEQIPARDNTRNYKAYPYPRSLADKSLYSYPYPPGTGRISGTHRVF